jgi:pimeloyl-ACP methyl ester carboxylesterase
MVTIGRDDPMIEYARNGDVSIAYEVFGDPAKGEPLLLIMGLDFQMVWWPDGFCQRLVDAGYAVARFDNRDTGLSTHVAPPSGSGPWRSRLRRPHPAYSGYDMLDDALAVLDAIGWSSAHVLGGSMGAALAQALTLVHPDRVRSLTSCMGLPVTAGPVRYLKFGAFPKFLRLRADGPVETLVEIFRILASPGYPFPEEWARRTAEISHQRSPRDPGVTQRQLAAGRTFALPSLATIAVPTLVINGADDPLVRATGGRDTARQIPGATFISYPGMGHDLPAALWPDIVDRISTTSRTGAGR